MSIYFRLSQWLLSGDTGSSSKLLAKIFIGESPEHIDYPSDPSDFGRCYRLLEAIPEVKGVVFDNPILTEHPIWGPYINHWDRLAELYQRDLPSGVCEELYREMKYFQFLQNCEQHGLDPDDQLSRRHAYIAAEVDEKAQNRVIEKVLMSDRRREFSNRQIAWFYAPAGTDLRVDGALRTADMNLTYSNKKLEIYAVDMPATVEVADHVYDLKDAFHYTKKNIDQPATRKGMKV